MLVIVLNALPVMLTKSNFLFRLVDIPAEKHASSSWIYSLNVNPLHQPVFWIWVSEYTTKDRALAPPLRREGVLIQLTGMPFAIW
jgi:hypothetical protein